MLRKKIQANTLFAAALVVVLTSFSFETEMGPRLAQGFGQTGKVHLKMAQDGGSLSGCYVSARARRKKNTGPWFRCQNDACLADFFLTSGISAQSSGPDAAAGNGSTEVP